MNGTKKLNKTFRPTTRFVSHLLVLTNTDIDLNIGNYQTDTEILLFFGASIDGIHFQFEKA